MPSKEHLNLFKGRIQDTLSSRARSSARASKCILDTITLHVNMSCQLISNYIVWVTVRVKLLYGYSYGKVEGSGTIVRTLTKINTYNTNLHCARIYQILSFI